MTQITEKTIAELEKVLTGICYVGELTPKSKDYVLSFGERLSAPIVWGAIKDRKLETQCFTGKEAGIVTDSNFGEADPLMNFTTHLIRERLSPLLEKGVIPVVTGYIAADQNGVVTTVGRGGSDYTATILGVALGADEIWIWTDVDGIMTTDPKIVPAAKMLPQLSYQEAAEMAIFGAKAMHPRALGPVIKQNVPVRIRSVAYFTAIREGGPIPLYAAPETAEALERIYEYTFSPKATYPTRARVQLRPLDERTAVHGVEFLRVPVQHGEMEIAGFCFGRAAYLTDVSAIPESSFALSSAILYSSQFQS